MNEMEFRQRAAELGYGEPQVKAYPPNATSELHAHDFSAFAMVANGEFILAFENGDTTYGPGDAARWRPVRGTPKSRVRTAQRCGSRPDDEGPNAV